jgi:hypothetical protein
LSKHLLQPLTLESRLAFPNLQHPIFHATSDDCAGSQLVAFPATAQTHVVLCDASRTKAFSCWLRAEKQPLRDEHMPLWHERLLWPHETSQCDGFAQHEKDVLVWRLFASLALWGTFFTSIQGGENKPPRQSMISGHAMAVKIKKLSLFSMEAKVTRNRNTQPTA